MEVRVCHTGKTKFRIEARQHAIESDQPAENGGEDAAMTPPEIFLASLGSCAAFYAAQFLSSRKLADHGLEVSVQAEKLRDPARLGNFVLKVESPVDLTPDQTQVMERSVHRCLIHQTMLQPPQIAIEIIAAQAVPENA
ncbi:MAG: OsmC family protein [Acidobacteriaceae bacterium]